MNSIDKLIQIGSEPFSLSPPKDLGSFGIPKKLKNDLFRVLRKKNGFFAFESSLLLLPSETSGRIPGIDDWNSTQRWLRYYSHVGTHVLFFAMDLFACQFGLSPRGVIRLNPESGQVEVHSSSLAEWADKILADYDYESGWSLGKKWQEQNGPIAPGFRLLGKKPFVLGGGFQTQNLITVEMFDAMEKLGKLFGQIKDIPDGEQVTIHDWF
jgi:hypothetical protein